MNLSLCIECDEPAFDLHLTGGLCGDCTLKGCLPDACHSVLVSGITVTDCGHADFRLSAQVLDLIGATTASAVFDSDFYTLTEALEVFCTQIISDPYRKAGVR